MKDRSIHADRRVRYRHGVAVSDPTDDASDDPEPTPAPVARRRRRSGTVEALGNAIVGFDYAILRSTRPPAILVEAAKPVRGLSGEDGRLLSIEFPEDAPLEASGDPAGEPPDDTPPGLGVG